MKFSKILLLLALAAFTFVAACKKEEDEKNPPAVEFKTGSGYTSADATVAKGTAVKVGIKATKTEDDLKTFAVSYIYDAATSTTTFQNTTITTPTGYDIDVNITARSVAGTEKWYFTITDIDGNITQKTITLTVN
jgi:ABC-type amino acid transport substrate-binding protein